jgi:hypothetical protein
MGFTRVWFGNRSDRITGGGLKADAVHPEECSGLFVAVWIGRAGPFCSWLKLWPSQVSLLWVFGSGC